MGTYTITLDCDINTDIDVDPTNDPQDSFYYEATEEQVASAIEKTVSLHLDEVEDFLVDICEYDRREGMAQAAIDRLDEENSSFYHE